MKPDIPILMITLHIPVLPDTDADQVLEAIGQQVSEALDAVRQQQATETSEETDLQEVQEAKSRETLEPYTEDTEEDLLAALGYKARK